MFRSRPRAAYCITSYQQLREIYDAPEIDSTLYHTILSNDNILTRPSMPDMYHQIPALLQQLVLLGINFGEFGWALLDIKALDADNTTLHHAPILLKYAIKHADLQVIIDEIVGALFNETTLDKMHSTMNEWLSEEDALKLDIAYQLYYHQEYYACALILSSLIDAQSITCILRDYNNVPEMIHNPSQGWQSFAKIVTQNYGDYLSLTWEDTKTKEKPRVHFQQKFALCDPDSELAAHVAYVANLSIAMMTFFANHAWNSQTLPASINRNYLAHGMYNMFDVNKNDCLKILVLLYQMLLLYKELQFKDVKHCLPDNVHGGECLSQ